MKEELLALAERVEKADAGEHHALLIAAFEAVNGPRHYAPRPGITRWRDGWFEFEKLLKAGGYLDAAMSLVVNKDGCGFLALGDGFKAFDGIHVGSAATPALALTAACLKALASAEVAHG